MHVKSPIDRSCLKNCKHILNCSNFVNSCISLKMKVLNLFGILRYSSFHLRCYCTNLHFLSLNNAVLLYLGILLYSLICNQLLDRNISKTYHLAFLGLSLFESLFQALSDNTKQNVLFDSSVSKTSFKIVNLKKAMGYFCLKVLIILNLHVQLTSTINI